MVEHLLYVKCATRPLCHLEAPKERELDQERSGKWVQESLAPQWPIRGNGENFLFLPIPFNVLLAVLVSKHIHLKGFIVPKMKNKWSLLSSLIRIMVRWTSWTTKIKLPNWDYPYDDKIVEKSWGQMILNSSFLNIFLCKNTKANNFFLFRCIFLKSKQLGCKWYSTIINTFIKGKMCKIFMMATKSNKLKEIPEGNWTSSNKIRHEISQ